MTIAENHPGANDPGAATPNNSQLTLDAVDVLSALASCVRGLDNEEAHRRLARDRFNELPTSCQRPIALALAAQFTNMFVVVLDALVASMN